VAGNAVLRVSWESLAVPSLILTAMVFPTRSRAVIVPELLSNHLFMPRKSSLNKLAELHAIYGCADLERRIGFKE